jgi:hypothetical protein
MGCRSSLAANRSAGAAVTPASCFLRGSPYNAAERALRGLALGRKAWLFAGSDRGGQRAALLYSLIVTAKLNDVDPQALARRRAASDQRSPSLASL